MPRQTGQPLPKDASDQVQGMACKHIVLFQEPAVHGPQGLDLKGAQVGVETDELEGLQVAEELHSAVQGGEVSALGLLEVVVQDP
eukprot:2850329-Lingulodinium_polyedra.AAC.1